jgi:hypothetical protein
VFRQSSLVAHGDQPDNLEVSYVDCMSHQVAESVLSETQAGILEVS